MTYEVVLTESCQPTEIGRPYTSEVVVKTGLTYEDARREALMANTKAFSNQYYSVKEVK